MLKRKVNIELKHVVVYFEMSVVYCREFFNSGINKYRTYQKYSVEVS